MKKRTKKKLAKKYMDWFTKTKLPLAFKAESERMGFVRMWANRRTGYRLTKSQERLIEEANS